MISLDIKVYDKNFVSIKDLSNDLNISDAKWNRLFELLTKVFKGFYFFGNRIWTNSDELDQTLDYLSEEILIDQNKDHSKILFHVKESFLIYNRKLVSQVWDYYEYPCFIFLGENENEQILIQEFKNNLFYDDIVEKAEDIIIMYRSFEPDVLWIKSDINVAEIIESVFN